MINDDNNNEDQNAKSLLNSNSKLVEELVSKTSQFADKNCGIPPQFEGYLLPTLQMDSAKWFWQHTLITPGMQYHHRIMKDDFLRGTMACSDVFNSWCYCLSLIHI